MLALQAILLYLPLTLAQDSDPEFRSGFESVSCYNTTALKVIYKGRTDEVIVPCTSPRPYCHQNTCVQALPDKPFFCEENGIFPHMNDCNGAYFCKDNVLIDIPCPENILFSNEKKACNMKNWRGACKKPECRGRHGVFTAHPASDRLYVFCLDEKPDSMHVCPLGKQFSPSSSVPCEFACIGVGDFPDFEDEELYYRCTWDGNKIVQSSQFCPRGMRFEYNRGGSRCVPKSDSTTTRKPDEKEN